MFRKRGQERALNAPEVTVSEREPSPPPPPGGVPSAGASVPTGGTTECPTCGHEHIADDYCGSMRDDTAACSCCGAVVMLDLMATHADFHRRFENVERDSHVE